MRKAHQIPLNRRRRVRKESKSDPPKVFLSHASEDKRRFVVDFATRLRARGIDVWLDRWEMLPGDSLVRKIFEEGIQPAKAVIVVISRHSVAKRWVREELDAAFVKRVNSDSKLIPVVIDDCRVPECLLTTIWEKIDDLNSYQASLDRIVLSIFGQKDKPPVGRGPAFAQKPAITIGGLTRVDSFVLQAACEISLNGWRNRGSVDQRIELRSHDLVRKTKKLGISKRATWNSVAILMARRYFVRPMWGELEVEAARMSYVEVTRYGFDQYLRARRPDYESLLKQFASNIVNKGMRRGKMIRKALKVHEAIFLHFFAIFWLDWKWFKAIFTKGDYQIFEISPEMKRWLEM